MDSRVEKFNKPLFIVLLQREDVYKIVQQFILLQVLTIFFFAKTQIRKKKRRDLLAMKYIKHAKYNALKFRDF